jgi:hypothetical protein
MATSTKRDFGRFMFGMGSNGFHSVPSAQKVQRIRGDNECRRGEIAPRQPGSADRGSPFGGRIFVGPVGPVGKFISGPVELEIGHRTNERPAVRSEVDLKESIAHGLGDQRFRTTAAAPSESTRAIDWNSPRECGDQPSLQEPLEIRCRGSTTPQCVAASR